MNDTDFLHSYGEAWQAFGDMINCLGNFDGTFEQAQQRFYDAKARCVSFKDCNTEVQLRRQVLYDDRNPS